MIDSEAEKRARELTCALERFVMKDIDFGNYVEGSRPQIAYALGYQKATANLQEKIHELSEIFSEMKWFLEIKEKMKDEIISELRLCEDCRDEFYHH